MASELSRQRRNDLCGCGSGKKFKRCCGSPESPQADAQGSFFRIAGVLAAAMLLIGGIAVARSFVTGDGAAQQRVWSAEHGHWHVKGGTEGTGTRAVAAGKVWNEEHGHFHEAPDIAHETKPQPGALEERARAEAEAAGAKAAAAAK